ncbi:MAG: hypothetical protein ACK40O_05995 [Allosphingosinicella sp.]
MKMVIALGALVLAGTAGPAVAADDSDDRQKAKQICKTYKETGSRLGGKRVCMTAEQWAEQRRMQQDAIERAQTQQVNKSGS